METVKLINTYINYLIYLLIIIVIACLIALIINLKPLFKTLNAIQNKTKEISKNVENTTLKLNKIEETVNESLPLFGLGLFIYVLISSIIKDYRNTKINKRSILKSAIKEYGIVNRKFNPSKTKFYRNIVLSQIKKLV